MIGWPVHMSIGRNTRITTQRRGKLGWFVGSVDPYKMLLILCIRSCLDSKSKYNNRLWLNNKVKEGGDEREEKRTVSFQSV
jgi:hypothetical protein